MLAAAVNSAADMATPWKALLLWLPLFFLVSWASFFLRRGKRRAKLKGSMGELAVNHLALHRLGDGYRVYKDLYLPRPDSNGTTQVDHIVVSIYGIFVIETKNYTGWIFGSEQSKYWTQCLKGGAKFRFQNPLHQNKLHVNALKKVLGLPAASFHSIVYFIGECTFKTSLPENVILRGLKNHILGHRDPVLTSQQVHQACERLNSYENDKGELKALHQPRS